MTALVRRSLSLALQLTTGAVCVTCHRVRVERLGSACSPACWTARHPS